MAREKIQRKKIKKKTFGADLKNLAANKINLFSYGILAFPLAFAGIPLYILAPDFYSNTLGVSLAKIGFLLLILRAVDAVQDPVIGYLSDKYSSRKKALFISGFIFLCSGIVGIFNPTGDNLELLFFINILLATTGFSIVSINLSALGGVWSEDYNEKTKISSAREIFGLLGLIAAASLPAILMNFYDDKISFKVYSLIFVAIAVTCFILFFSGWLKKTKFQKSVDKTPLKNFKISFSKNRNFFLVYFLSIFASSIPAILIIFFVRDVLELESYLGLFLIAYFLSGALSMPVWYRVSKHLSKITAWKYSMILAVVSFIWAYFLEADDFYQFIMICIFSGIAFGAELALPPSILADNVSRDYSNVEYSILTFLMKLGLALSAGVIYPLLEASGYVPSQENTKETLWYLGLYYALVPCFIKIIAVILLIILFKKEGEKNEEINIVNGGGYVSR